MMMGAMKPRLFGHRLHHDVPSWAEAGNFSHLRIRVDRQQTTPLTEPVLANALLESVSFYHAKGRWWLSLFVLMPDHLHALVAFPHDTNMSRTIGEWKHWHARRHGIRWQEGYFDHRVREDERGEQLQGQANYILHNPVVRDLCAHPDEWPWKINHLEVDGALRRAIGSSREAR